MGLRQATFLLLCLAPALLRAEPSIQTQVQAQNILYAAAKQQVNAGNRYDAIVQQGLQNAPAGGNAVQRAVTGSFISADEAKATLDATVPFVSNTPVPGSPASTFWNNAANQTQAQFDQAVQNLNKSELIDMAKAAPAGAADGVPRDIGAKARQAAADAAEGVAGETARFWGLMRDSLEQSKQDQAAAQANGVNDCVDAACRFSQNGWAIWTKAMEVGQAITEFAQTRDANVAIATVGKNEDAAVAGPSSTGVTLPADSTSPVPGKSSDPGNAIPPDVADALVQSGLNPTDLENRLAAGDQTVYSEVAGALDQSGDAAGAADAVRDFASNATPDSDSDSAAAKAAPPPVDPARVAQAAAANQAQVLAAQRAAKAQAAAKVVEALRRNYARKHGGRIGDDDGYGDSVALAARRAKAQAARSGTGSLSDEALYNLLRAGVQRRRDRANIFQVARLTYKKQATSQTVRRAHASAAPKAPFLLAGAAGQ